MKRRTGLLFILGIIVVGIMGFIGFIITPGFSLWDALYYTVRMYFLDADTRNNNFLIEFARWIAPVLAVGGLVTIFKKFFARMKNFFFCYFSDAVAVYGDTELREIVKKNIKHAISVENDEVWNVRKHIILFSSDEKGLEFYTKNKEKLKGEVFLKLDKNDSFSVSLENVKFFNPCELIARAFWHERDIRQILKKDDMKIAIVGSDVLSRKILKSALLNNIYSLTQKIEYQLWSNDEFFKKAYGEIKTMNGDKVVYKENESEDRIFEIASADRIIITEQIGNEYLAEIVELTDGEIYIFDPKGTFVNMFGYDKIYPFGRYSDVLTEENIRTDNLYSFAKQLNYSYTLKYLKDGEPVPTMEEAWDALDSFTKESNIAATDHHKITLILMKETGKTEVDYTIAEIEHIRWCRFHLINHWKHGETPDGKKDTEKRIHPCLEPFEELNDENKLKDVDCVNTLLSLEPLTFD